MRVINVEQALLAFAAVQEWFLNKQRFDAHDATLIDHLMSAGIIVRPEDAPPDAPSREIPMAEPICGAMDADEEFGTGLTCTKPAGHVERGDHNHKARTPEGGSVEWVPR